MFVELVTLQGNHTRHWLAGQRIYRPGWRNGGETNPWNRAYRWMSLAMCRRGLATHGHPPVWAWPKSRALGGPPTFTTADALLSDAERAAGVWVLELSVPPRYCLRSCYRQWNRVLDEFIEGAATCDRRYRLFDTALYRYAAPLEPDDIQFCLPFIDRNWIRRVRPLPSRPKLNNWDAAI